MRSMLIIAAALLATALAWAQEAEQKNLVSNPGFEETVGGKTVIVHLAGGDTVGKDKYPKGQMPTEVPLLKAWGFQVWSKDVGVLSLDNETFFEGKQSVKIDLSGERASLTLRQSVKGVKADTEYVVKFKIKRTNPKQTVMVRVYRYPEKEVVTTTLKQFGKPDEQGWGEGEYTFKTLGKTTSLLLILAPWQPGQEDSTVWLDDVQLVEKVEQ